MREIRVLALLVLLGVFGCGGGEESPQGLSASPEANLAALLLAADRADGHEDRIVARCAVCGLGMDGSAEIASTYAGYTFHHCSPHCRELFDRDPVKILTRLELPPPEGATGAE